MSAAQTTPSPFTGLAFKIMNDPFVGSLDLLFVIYSGTLKKGDRSVYNATKGKRERVGRMMMMHSNNREEIKEAFSQGDIVSSGIGMKETTTGDTHV